MKPNKVWMLEVKTPNTKYNLSGFYCERYIIKELAEIDCERLNKKHNGFKYRVRCYEAREK
jgi:hypothetical protein